MNEKHTSPNLFHLIRGVTIVLLQWKKLIIIVMCIVGFFTALLTLVVPKSYTSYSLIYPSSGPSSTGLMGLLSGTPFSNSGSLSLSQGGESGFLMSLFKSRTIIDAVIDEFNLMEVYNYEIRQELINKLWDDVEIFLNDRGAIELSFSAQTDWFTNPYGEDTVVKNRSQKILEFIINEADRMNIQLNTQSAHFQRKFLEQRYEVGIEDLDSLKAELIKFQKQYGIVNIEEQVLAKVQILSELKSELIKNDIQQEMLESLLSSKNPRLKSVEIEGEVLRSKLYALEEESLKSKKSLDKFLPSLDAIPRLSLEMIQRRSEIEAQIQVLKFLRQQLEEARLREAKETPTIQVIDNPSFPEKRSSPKRLVTVLVTGFIIFFLLSFTILIYDSNRRIE